MRCARYLVPLTSCLWAISCGSGTIDGGSDHPHLLPVAADDSVSTNEDQAVTIDVLANDTHPDGLRLTVSEVSSPIHGTTTLEPDQTIDYQPSPDFNGSDELSYSVAGPDGGRASATVRITILPINDPPLVQDDSGTTNQGEPIRIAVLDNDTDPDGDDLSIESVSDPPGGTAAIQADQTVLYTPDPAFTGADAFNYDVVDGNGGTATATVNVTVNAVVQPTVILPKSSIGASELAVIVNDNDPQSVAVAAYYQQKRSIPDGNMIHVRFAAGGTVLSRDDFATVKAAVDAGLSPEIQAFALTWTTPYRVDCMSITSAFALGFDLKYCNTVGGCAVTAPVAYYGSESVRPFTDHGIRPTMALAGTSFENVKALIDRGLAADDTFPPGTGYFIRTRDTARSVRWPDFKSTTESWDYPEGLELVYIDNSAGAAADVIQNQTDVLFYLTGLSNVPDIATNTYRPGALADHVTSYGGDLTGGGQMSILRWLEAGATASFGTVVEPCNFTQKFPASANLVRFYFRGQTALEAYWKSVVWPGEGIFVGEPLARPWGRATVTFENHTLTIRATWLNPAKTYELRAADAEAGPFTTVLAPIKVLRHQLATITLENATRPFYRLAETGEP